MFFFYIDGQNGMRGAMASIGMSLALYGVNYATEYVQVPPIALIGAVVFCCLFLSYFFGQRILERLSRDWQRSFPATPKNAQFDSILTRLRSTPVHIWEPANELSIHELRKRITEIHLGDTKTIDHIVERKELEKSYHELFDVCSICTEPWTSDDIYRRLPRCGHCFHLECIDRWALTMADKQIVPSCPLCKHTF